MCRFHSFKLIIYSFSVLTLDELLDAYHDTHANVRKAASRGLTYILTSHPEYISEVIVNVNKGLYPSSVLDMVLSLPTIALLPAKEELIALFSSKSDTLRRIMVRNAAIADWLTKEQAIGIAQLALKDNDLTVRNLAIGTLRSRKSVA